MTRRIEKSNSETRTRMTNNRPNDEDIEQPEAEKVAGERDRHPRRLSRKSSDTPGGAKLTGFPWELGGGPGPARLHSSGWGTEDGRVIPKSAHN